MAREKREDPITLKIREIRKEIKKRTEGELLKEYEEQSSQGRYPWERMWLRPQDIERIQERLKKRDKIIVAEIIILFFLFSFFSLITYRLLVVIFLP